MKGFVCVAVLVLALGVAASSSPAPSGELDVWMEQMLAHWTQWRKSHGKSYASDVEEAQRFGIFVDNVKFIHSTNAKRLSYTVGVNEFADLSFAEWQSRMQLQRPAALAPAPAKPAAHLRPSAKLSAKTQAKAKANPPAAWDWRTHGAVNPVQNQGQCGSCWAFTAGDAVSGIWAIETGVLFPVSVQEIVDCSGSQGNEGCNGGFPSAAFQWVMANGGICDWQEYQYTAETGTCGSTNCTNVARITNFVSIPAGDEAALMGATWQQPLSCAVEAATQSWQFYTGGVLNDPTCDTNVNHGVTLIGWGHDAPSGLDYWLVRNMWGASWGEQGYIRIVRNKNMCGIAEVVAYPTLTL